MKCIDACCAVGDVLLVRSLLGRGAFGNVYEGVLSVTSEPADASLVAVKVSSI